MDFSFIAFYILFLFFCVKNFHEKRTKARIESILLLVFFGSVNSNIAFKSLLEPEEYKIKCSAG
ncbi:hypothetical protein ATZ36_11765 [Candidatus Endomicrobiellum trichonymphae]|uniref:Uncharacterized protein n=1 Tax=Endomicrobium trichonymphae TaxID=1408204 RepID=A0A1E5IN96_ENDTX|nr:hypothetical protein ATZ36_11765 [Candidatus Endomicrobium trichonymphae]